MSLNNSGFMPQHHGQNSTLWVIVLAVVAAIAFGLAAWSLVGYLGEKSNVDGRIADAVVEAKKEQADADEAKFAAREKEPNRTFAGPEDFGRLSFKYPKTWSVYIAKDIGDRSGDYEAYLHPVSVPPVSKEERFALRVVIETEDYDKAIDSYANLVKDGDLSSSAVESNGHKGTRFDGNFTDEIRGSAVLFKIRDKVVTIRTDANTFKADFDKLIKTIDFND